MRKWIAAVAVSASLALASTIAATASTTSINASPASAGVGQTVTFTAMFTSSCSGTIKPHYFTIDGQKYFGQLVMSGQSGVETYSTSTLSAGRHTVKYYWQTSTASCIGSTSIPYTVTAGATPAASPSPSPVPSPTPSPSPTPRSTPSSSPAPHPSSSPVVLAATNDGAFPLGYLGAALIVITVVSGVALAVLGRR